MKKILGLLAIVLGLTTIGCSMNVPTNVQVELPQNKIELPQNKIEWIVTDDESRGLWGMDGLVCSLDSVTFEIYRVPKRGSKYIFEEADYLGAKLLNRGKSFTVPSAKDYNYEFVTQVRCIEFNWSFVFGGEKDYINFFDYEDDIVMEVAKYCYGPLEHIEERDGWTIDKGIIHYRDEVNGWEINYIFLNENSEAMSKFYGEHKYGGRIVWDNN